MTRRGSLHPLYQLARGNSCTFGAALLVAGALGGNSPAGTPWRRVGLAAAMTWFAIAFAQTYNDLVDVEADAAAGRHRPLVTGTVSPSAARLMCTAVIVASLVASAFSHPLLVPIAGSTIVLSFFYSRWLKGIPIAGTLTVAALAAFPVPVGAWLTTRSVQIESLALYAQILTLQFAFEILKAARDIEVDRKFHISTTAVWLGLDRSLVLSFGLTIIFSLLTVVVILAFRPSLLFCVAFGFVSFLVVWIARSAHRRGPNYIGRVLRGFPYAWGIGIVGLALF
ncbi:MAG: UbiA family prenyltransferase [Gammaproteobacteria bacterium]